MAEILDGKNLSEKIITELKKKVDEQEKKPGLAVLIIGKNPTSLIYVNKKEDACKAMGVYSEKHMLPEDVNEEEVIKLIKKLNYDKKIHGILIQLPLPDHLNENRILNELSPLKDVDGLNPLNLGKLLKSEDSFIPCTPKGIMRLLKEYNINLKGKNVVIINHSNIVGKPLSLMMLNKNATVTVCHIDTKDLMMHTKNADILITAAGVPGLIKTNMLKERVIVIDAGIYKRGNKIMGDVDFENVSKIASYITPVPGGVGPMTVAMLMENTLLAMKKTDKP